ncbi:uncharacterized protein LOC110677144 [Aedes aegypti]|uniref:Uncharacterized protein n=1 Tax=Aedes aegypti TaxID=7159 RepID=A0A6I8U1B2_AEDAE|nr:uncharacterized protein LOC110677144 [Aedes aegypti]
MEGLCRTCLTALGAECSALPVFNKTETGDTIAALLGKYCCLEITDSDPLPKQICSPCFSELIATINFRQKCANSEQSLLQMTDDKQTVLIAADDSEPVEYKPPAFVEVLENHDATSCSLPIENETNEEPSSDCYTMIEMMSFRVAYVREFCTARKIIAIISSRPIKSRFHVILLHFELHFTCFICSNPSTTWNSWEAHQGRSFMELFQCNNCEDIYETVETCVQHYEHNHSNELIDQLNVEEVAPEPVTVVSGRKGESSSTTKGTLLLRNSLP